MKNIIILIIVIVTAGTPACKRYLDVQPRDLKLAQSVKDYQDLLNGEGFKKQLALNGIEDLNFLEMLTDDVTQQMGALAVDARSRYSSYYVWRNNFEIEYSTEGLSQINAKVWQYLYKIVNVCNIVLNEIDDVPGPAADRAFAKADAHFTRAFAYYFILNIWGQPYEPATAATAKGVPLKLSAVAEFQGLPRNSVLEGYNQIISDLQKAETFILESGLKKDIFSVSPEAIYLLRSRVHLYMQEWEQAIRYADKVLEIKPELYDLLPETFVIGNLTSTFLNPRNQELIFSYYNRPAIYVVTYGTAVGRHYSVSNELNNLYVAADKRKSAFLVTNPGVPSTLAPKVMTPSEGIKTYNYYFRTSEAYLNRAEAYAQLEKLPEAATDYNYLRQHRITGITDISFTDKAHALDLIYKERRMELAFQFHRWFDLRRTTRPRLTHLWRQNTSASTPTHTFVLEENDPGYTLEIPEAEIQMNTAIELLNLGIRQPQ